MSVIGVTALEVRSRQDSTLKKLIGGYVFILIVLIIAPVFYIYSWRIFEGVDWQLAGIWGYYSSYTNDSFWTIGIPIAIVANGIPAIFCIISIANAGARMENDIPISVKFFIIPSIYLVIWFFAGCAAMAAFFIVAVTSPYMDSNYQWIITPASFISGIAGMATLGRVAKTRLGPWMLPPLTQERAAKMRPRYKRLVQFVSTFAKLEMAGAVQLDDFVRAMGQPSGKAIRRLIRLNKKHLIEGHFNPLKTIFYVDRINLPFLGQEKDSKTSAIPHLTPVEELQAAPRLTSVIPAPDPAPLVFSDGAELDVVPYTPRVRSRAGTVPSPPELPQETDAFSSPQIIETMSPEERTEKLKEILQVSKRLEIGRLAKILKIDEDSLWNEIFTLAKAFNFKIDGQFLVMEGADIDGFIESIDKQFGEWEGKTETKDGKL